MDAKLKCQTCNNSQNLGRILPCNKLICTDCIEQNKQQSGTGYKIKCDCACKQHLITSTTSTNPNSLKHQIDEARSSLELAKFDVSRHYDDMEMKIDIRAETLIEFIHDSRDSLHAEIKQHRKNTESLMESFEKKYNSDYKKLEVDFQVMSSRLCDANLSVDVKNSDLSKFVQEFNKLQKSIDDLKSKSWYFLENTQQLDKSLLGYNFNNSLDKNFYKIKNLRSLLSSPGKNSQLQLKSQFSQVNLRHYVIPLNRNRIISCYFTKTKSIYLELFDRSGNSLKLVQVAESATYFPIFSSTSSHFVLGYLSRISDLFGDATINFVALYDSELNLVRTVRERSSIESIFMNEARIVCSFGHRTYECCKVFDLELNYVDSFGQQTDAEKPFYMERAEVSAAQFAKEKYNPVVFGYNEEKIYFYNKKSMTVVCKQTGCVLKQLEKSNEKSFFVLDSQSNVIEVNTHANFIRLHNFHIDMSVCSTYDTNYENVCFVDDQHFVFVHSNKENILFV